jgi:hypothetical protein
VSEAQGHKMKSEIGAVEFFECSALKNEGVHKLFETVARISLAEKRTQLVVLSYKLLKLKSNYQFL